MVVGMVTAHEVLYDTRMLMKMVSLENGCTLLYLLVYRDTENDSILESINRHFLKSFLTWYNTHIKGTCMVNKFECEKEIMHFGCSGH